MNSSAMVWTVIALALVAANLPFVSNRLFLVRSLSGQKSLAWRLLELVLLYLLVSHPGLPRLCLPLSVQAVLKAYA